jgi:triphosphoribosyl-dephospho-CoA synthase
MADALPVGLCAQVACVLEATARKPGNVHRLADFADTHYLDFVLSAAAIAPVMERAIDRPLGVTILDAVRATRRVTRANTNLGIILLLAPLAAVPHRHLLRAGVRRVVSETTVEDARAAYEAIRLARPGGLGSSDEQDVTAEPTAPLWRVMELAADRDGVARQYATAYEDVFSPSITSLSIGTKGQPLEEQIIRWFLLCLARRPDTLIARKCGPAVAAEASRRAADCLRGASLAEFDIWLRADGNRRNPGTTADLVTACLFVSLRRGRLNLPLAPFSLPTPP